MNTEHLRSKGKTILRTTPLQDKHNGLGIKTKLTHLELPSKQEAANVESTAETGGTELVSDELQRYVAILPEEPTKIDGHHYANATYHVHILKEGENTVRIQHTESSSTQTVIVVPENVEATVYLENTSATEGLSTDHTTIIAEPNSEVKVYEYRKLGANHTQFTRRRSYLLRDATMHWYQADLNSKLLINDTQTHLVGNGSTGRTTTLFYGVNEQTFDLTAESVHHGENTYSLLRSKGALSKSTTTQRGLVKINKHAADSDGYQKADTLLLDEDARVVSIPDLEIHNPEVRCSHGSTISTLDDNQLLYCMSRGIRKAQAQRIVINGFFQPIIDELPDSEYKDTLSTVIDTRIDNQ